jgi:hypothetical protein
MDSRLTFLPRPISVEAPRDPGTKRGRLCGWPFKDVAQARSEYEKVRQLPFKSCGVGRQEKLSGEDIGRPYRKPTQVG